MYCILKGIVLILKYWVYFYIWFQIIARNIFLHALARKTIKNSILLCSKYTKLCYPKFYEIAEYMLFLLWSKGFTFFLFHSSMIKNHKIILHWNIRNCELVSHLNNIPSIKQLYSYISPIRTWKFIEKMGYTI